MRLIYIFMILVLLLFAGCSTVAPISVLSLDLDYLNETNNTIYYNGSIDITGNFLVNGTLLSLNGSISNLSLRDDCFNNQVLKWNGSEWVCGNDLINGSGSGSSANIISSEIFYDNNSNIDFIYDIYDVYNVNSSFEYDNNSIVQNATIVNSVLGVTIIEYVYNASGSLVEVIYT